MRHKALPRHIRNHYGVFQLLDSLVSRERVFRYFAKSRRNLYRSLSKCLVNSGQGKEIEIDRVRNIDRKDFERRYLLKNLPVVFEGKALDWRCVDEWTLDYFIEKHGNDIVQLADQQKLENSLREISLEKVLREIKAGNETYYRFYPLLKRHPQYINHFDYKWLRNYRSGNTILESFQVFIGGKDSYTPLHNANQSNFFTQIHGEKEWFLYPVEYTMIVDPDPAPNVYRRAPFKTKEGPFNPFNPNYNPPYNLYQYIDTYHTILKPGDILFNPPFFWHSVRNLSDTIGVGYRWLSPKQTIRSSALYSILDLFVNKPPIWKSYSLYKEDINLIHKAEKEYFR